MLHVHVEYRYISNSDWHLKKVEIKIIIKNIYCKTSNIRRILVGNKIVDHSDVVGASPVGAAPTTSQFSTEQPTSKDCVKATARQDEKQLSFGIGCVLY